jgi:L-aspartate oxidase
MTVTSDRHLLEVDLRSIPAYRFDVLIVGGGVAGGAAAMAAAAEGRSVAIITKAAIDVSNTNMAQGGMAAVVADDDSFESHIRDTLTVGCGLCDPVAVQRVVHGAPHAVQRLLDLGAILDRRQDGTLDRSREGGHTNPRVLHAHGDATGREMQRVITAALRTNDAIETFENTFALDVVTADGEAYGVVAAGPSGALVLYTADQIILATGGGGQIFRETTNPTIATADGVAMGYRAGAAIRDIEFFQFHPTCLYIAGAARVLISEIVRGAGGVLRDRHDHRFMLDSHQDAELAPRDIVSRAVFRRMIETGDTNVYLDLSAVQGEVHRMFPGISRTCRFFGIDIAHDPVPVRPGAHYMIGGMLVDSNGRTTLPRLWAVGECASSGLHGANRMGSNSLLEGMVLGESAGRSAGAAAGGRPRRRPHRMLRRAVEQPPRGIELGISDLVYSLKSLMWRQVGLERSGEAMLEAMSRLAFWADAAHRLAPPQPRAWELVNMLTVAQLATATALQRRETRGVHARVDFPATDQEACHSIVYPRSSDQHVVEAELALCPVGTVVAHRM